MAENALQTLDDQTMQNLVAGGDCSRLNPQQKIAYYRARCEAAGLDPRAQPFAFVRLSGKEVLYAQKAASDQLAAKHGVKMTIVSQVTEDGIRVVTVRAEARDGRVTEEIGALPVKGLQGEALSNALMKCVTKAKRRAILSLCGLGMLDETEVDSIPGAAPMPVAVAPRPEPKALPKPEPVVIPEVVDPTPEEKQAAKNIVAAAAELQAEIVRPLEHTETQKTRVWAIYNRATSPRGANISKGMFGAFVEKVLGEKVPSKAWTDEQMDALEDALAAMNRLPDEQAHQ